MDAKCMLCSVFTVNDVNENLEINLRRTGDPSDSPAVSVHALPHAHRVGGSVSQHELVAPLRASALRLSLVIERDGTVRA